MHNISACSNRFIHAQYLNSRGECYPLVIQMTHTFAQQRWWIIEPHIFLSLLLISCSNLPIHYIINLAMALIFAF